MTALLGCPFCGADDADYMPESLMAPGAEPPVFCNGCHVSANNAAAWNRRTPSPAVAGLVEALAVAMDEMSLRASQTEERGDHISYLIAEQIRKHVAAARSALAAYKQEIGG